MCRFISILFAYAACIAIAITAGVGCDKSDTEPYKEPDFTPPVANIQISGDLVVGGIVHLDGLTSADNQAIFNKGILSWRWDVYGDDTADGIEPTLDWTWNRPGTYMVNLVVTNQGGISSPAESVMVTIGLAGSEWPAVGRDLHHTSFVDAQVNIVDNATLWVSDEIGYFQGTTLAVAANLVFVTCSNASWSGITALDFDSGNIAWQAALDNIGYWDSRSSCAYHNGCLYVATYTNLVKLDAATGTELDIYDLGELLVNTDLTIAEGKVFLGTYEFMGNGSFAALDISDFTLLWRKQYPGLICTAAPAYDAGVLYVCTAPSFGSMENAAMMALNAETGDEIWKEPSPNGYSYFAPVTVDGDYVYGATFSFGAGGNTTIMKRNKSDGAFVWARPCGSASTPPTVTADGLVIVAGGSLGSAVDGRTTCFDVDGNLQWDNNSLGSFTGAPVVIGSHVFTSEYYYDPIAWTGWNTAFYCLDIVDGSVIWSFDGCGGSPSAVFYDPVPYIMVGSNDGKVYCFGG